jgi:hypothetical protein
VMVEFSKAALTQSVGRAAVAAAGAPIVVSAFFAATACRPANCPAFRLAPP